LIWQQTGEKGRGKGEITSGFHLRSDDRAQQAKKKGGKEGEVSVGNLKTPRRKKEGRGGEGKRLLNRLGKNSRSQPSHSGGGRKRKKKR